MEEKINLSFVMRVIFPSLIVKHADFFYTEIAITYHCLAAVLKSNRLE